MGAARLDGSSLARRPDMTYRVYSGPRGSETVPPLEKDSWLYKEFALLDEAMSWARHVNKGEGVALLVEGGGGAGRGGQHAGGLLRQHRFLRHRCRRIAGLLLVPRTRSSHNLAARMFANFGFKAALES